MDPSLTTESQGPSLPQSRFASTRFRASTAAIQPGRPRTLLPACGLLVVALPLLALVAPLVVRAQRPLPRAATNLTAAWQPLGPSSIVSATYNNLTGRITAIAPDPNDPSGNTVYFGATGGGVWKSTNAAGGLGAASFAPLTDTLPVFSNNAGGSAIPSLTIGALAVQPAANPVLIAGTGDPNSATDSYYGEGLLRSADGGLTWTLIQASQDGVSGFHSLIGLAAAGIAFSTATPTLVVAAFSTSAQAAIVNATTVDSFPGLYYSTDAGQTWQMGSIYDGGSVVQQPQSLGTGEIGNAVTSVVWDPLRSMFYAAVRTHGYYSSPDGKTWTRLATQPGVNLTTAKCPVGANGVGNVSTCPIYRGVLAVQPVTGDLYALTVDTNNLDQGLWQDLCGATSTTCAKPAPTFANRIDNGALEVGSGNTAIAQGSYNLVLNAAPAAANGTNLYVGTVDLYSCTIAAGTSGCTLRNTTNALDGCNAPAQVAGAQHAIATVAEASGMPILYLGNDGGLWRSLDGVAETGSVCSSTDNTHFDNLNAAIGVGGSLAEVTGFAEDPANPNVLITGLGGNGSAATSTAATLTPWLQLSIGEGGLPSIDASTPANWYATIGAGVNLDACPLGANCTAANFVTPATIGATQVDGDAALLDAPTLLDPALTSSVLVGTCRVWRGSAASGSAWSNANALSPALGGITTPCSPFSPLIRSLAAGGPSVTSANLQNSGSKVIYAGISGAQDGGAVIPGHLFVTTAADTATGAKAWIDASLKPVTNDTSDAHVFNPGHFDISSIAVDSHDATGATVYATVMGFGVPHLYRSTNFGGAWLNISANLPSAPVNAVLVDPNDANTVYVATDAGVYVTQAVTTCTTANCWSVLGTALPNAPIVTLEASASLPTGDGRVGMLRAGTYGRGLWQTPLLTAAAPSQAALTLSSSSLTFAAQQVATLSTAQTVTVTSSGDVPVSVTTLVLSGDFTETDTCAGQTLAVGSSCSVQIIFAPAATGARSGLLTIYANVPGGQATVALNGTGTAPAAIVLTPLVLSFPATIVNQTAPSQSITISNNGGTTATLSAPVLGGNASDFSIYANTCGATLLPGAGCTLTVTFTPAASGTRSATLSVTDNVGSASAATQTATLTGVGNAPATDTLSPLALSFAQQQIGTSSAAQTITLTNSGGVPLTLIAASVSPGDFAVVNACGNSLAAHATCAFNVTFSPTAIGTRTATLTVNDQFHSQTVTLSGIGIAGPGVSLTPVSLSFPATGVGLTALAQTLTLTNNGGLPLSISSVVASAGFNLAANTCGTSLAVHAACTLTVVFAPTAAGPAVGALTFTDNGPSGSQATSLSGTGIDFALTATSATSATIAGSGASTTYALQLASLNGLAGNVALSCSGAPANSTCTVVPGVAELGTTTPIAVTVETDVAVGALAPPARPFNTGRAAKAILVALLLPLALFTRRRRWARITLAVALMCGLGALGGCGASRTIPNATSPGTGTPTPTGTYTLTVSAAAAGLTHAVNLTLVVQ
ncbi:MAG: choice-of-anchor D domain-containing protein [Burkholderiales bacterium]|nr:choice-of-anchor D domain-containing protein [Burkholderiales bacterium]